MLRYSFLGLLCCLFTTLCFANGHHRYLLLSDIHLKQGSQAMDFTPTGYNRNNDMDQASLTRLLKPIKQRDSSFKSLDGIFVLGDLLGHNISDRKATLLKSLKAIQSLQLPTYLTFGNNDSLSGDYQAFESTNKQSLYTLAQSTWASSNGFIPTSKATLAQCKPNKAPCVFSQNKHHGYYAAWLDQNLAVIALNSVLYNANVSPELQAYGQDQLHWLKDTLKTLSSQKASVILTMHVPPVMNLYSGLPHWHALQPKDPDFYERQFIDALSTASSQGAHIIGLFAGHTHYDETHLIQLSNDSIVPVFIIPGLSTSHGNAPGLKVIELQYNTSTKQWQIQDTIGFHALKPNNVSYQPYGSRLQTLCEKTTIKRCLSNLSQHLQKLMQWDSKHYNAGNPHHQAPNYTNPQSLMRQ